MQDETWPFPPTGADDDACRARPTLEETASERAFLDGELGSGAPVSCGKLY